MYLDIFLIRLYIAGVQTRFEATTTVPARCILCKDSATQQKKITMKSYCICNRAETSRGENHDNAITSTRTYSSQFLNITLLQKLKVLQSGWKRV